MHLNFFYFFLGLIFPVFASAHRMSLRDKGKTLIIDDDCLFCGTCLRIGIDDTKQEAVCYCYKCEQIVDGYPDEPDGGDSVDVSTTKELKGNVVDFKKAKRRFLLAS